MRPIQTNATVRIDPATLVAYPLSKERIAVYNCESYERDVPFIASTSPESLRIDLGCGAEWMPWTRDQLDDYLDLYRDTARAIPTCSTAWMLSTGT